jgi:hypothetical protein
MCFLHKISKILRDESGAVTVDWVVLTAAIMLMGAVALSVYRPALEAGASEISGSIVDVGASLSPVTT